VRLILVRHGQTASNLVHALDTAVPGPPLTELGQQQAANLVPDLASEAVDVIAASPLLRAQQTAAPLAAARRLPVRTLNGLQEIDAGELEMQTSPTAIKQYLDVAFAWASGDMDARVPGALSGREVLAAFDAAVRELETTASAAIAVSHGAVIRAWAAARAANIDVTYVRTHPLANTGVVVLDGDGADGWRVLSWHDRSGAEQPVSGMQDTGGVAS
jgi:broad specificity phosphatase PhoE